MKMFRLGQGALSIILNRKAGQTEVSSSINVVKCLTRCRKFANSTKFVSNEFHKQSNGKHLRLDFSSAELDVRFRL